MDFNKIEAQTIELVKEVGAYVRSERLKFLNNGIEAKGSNDFVTYVDKASEERLVAGLSKIIPEAGFIAEEGTREYDNEEYAWIIDPIDGTTNFIHGAPPYCISVGLRKGEELIAGVVYEISADECFYAFNGGKAYLNGKEIHVSTTKTVAGSLIATGFPYSDYDLLDNFMKTMDYFFHHSHGVRRLGSAAADLAYVACGRYDAFYEYNLKPWDVAGGVYILQQAGGKVSDFKKGGNYLFGEELITSNAYIWEEFSQVVSDIMNSK